MLERLKKISFGNAEEYYSKLYFIFNISVGISLLPFTFIFLDVLHRDIPSQITGPLRMLLLLVLVGLATFTYYVGYTRFKKGITNAIGESTLINKMRIYYESQVDKFVWFMTSSFLSIVGLVTTRSFVFIVAYLFTLGSLSIFRPTFKSLIKDLRLDDEQKRVLMDNEAIV